MGQGVLYHTCPNVSRIEQARARSRILANHRYGSLFLHYLLCSLVDAVHWVRYARVLPPLLSLEFGLSKGFDRWMEIGVKWCFTGLVTVLLGLTECQPIRDQLLLD